MQKLLSAAFVLSVEACSELHVQVSIAVVVYLLGSAATIAQLVEHHVANVKVMGSNPICRSML